MNFQDAIHSPKANPVTVYILLFFFLLNDKLIKSKKFHTFIWEYLKLELFYIGGQCEHSGNCCKNLMIVREGQSINTTEKYNAVIKKDPLYTKFVPQKIEGPKIKHFSCNCLTPNNWCSDYENRPKLCHNYPASSFIQFDKIQKECGYKVRQKNIRLKINNTSLNTLILKIKDYNHIQ